MKKLILHIGPNKTGSTYLQRRLHQQRDILRQDGICYPTAFFRISGHHQLVKLLTEGNFEEIKRQWMEFKDDADTIILSAEDLWRIDVKRLRILKELEPDLDIRIIFYYRRPSSRLLSQWQESIKKGKTKSYFTFISPRTKNPLASKDVNHVDYLLTLIDEFGASSVAIVDYEQATKKGLVANFCSAAGINTSITDTREIVNKSLDFIDLEIIRALNIENIKVTGKTSKKIRKLYKKSKQSIPEQMLKPLHLNIKSSLRKVQVGNEEMDKAVERQLHAKCPEQLVDFSSRRESKTFNVPADSWLKDESNQKLIHDVYSVIMEIENNFSEKNNTATPEFDKPTKMVKRLIMSAVKRLSVRLRHVINR